MAKMSNVIITKNQFFSIKFENISQYLTNKLKYYIIEVKKIITRALLTMIKNFLSMPIKERNILTEVDYKKVNRYSKGEKALILQKIENKNILKEKSDVIEGHLNED